MFSSFDKKQIAWTHFQTFVLLQNGLSMIFKWLAHFTRFFETNVMSDPFHIRGDYIKGMLYEVS
jgi:hypothetical protein